MGRPYSSPLPMRRIFGGAANAAEQPSRFLVIASVPVAHRAFCLSLPQPPSSTTRKTTPAVLTGWHREAGAVRLYLPDSIGITPRPPSGLRQRCNLPIGKGASMQHAVGNHGSQVDPDGISSRCVAGRA